MNYKHGRKNDFFYAAVVFAMFAVVVFNVVAAYVEFHPDAYFAGNGEVAAPRAVAAEAGAHVAVPVRPA